MVATVLIIRYVVRARRDGQGDLSTAIVTPCGHGFGDSAAAGGGAADAAVAGGAGEAGVAGVAAAGGAGGAGAAGHGPSRINP
jgi:hypothetical protein